MRQPVAVFPFLFVALSWAAAPAHAEVRAVNSHQLDCLNTAVPAVQMLKRKSSARRRGSLFLPGRHGLHDTKGGSRLKPNGSRKNPFG